MLWRGDGFWSSTEQFAILKLANIIALSCKCKICPNCHMNLQLLINIFIKLIALLQVYKSQIINFVICFIHPATFIYFYYVYNQRIKKESRKRQTNKQKWGMGFLQQSLNFAVPLHLFLWPSFFSVLPLCFFTYMRFFPFLWSLQQLQVLMDGDLMSSQFCVDLSRWKGVLMYTDNYFLPCLFQMGWYLI